MVDKRMRNLIYAAIAVVCIVSILLGVFRIFMGEDTNTTASGNGTTTVVDNTQVALREEFNILFNNKIIGLTNEDTMNILKAIPEESLILTGFDKGLAYSSISDGKDVIDKDKCEIDVHFPKINLQGDYINTVYVPTMTEEFYNIFLARFQKGAELSKNKTTTIQPETNVVENQNEAAQNTSNQTVETVTGKYIYEANFGGTIYQNKYLSIAIMSLDKIPGKSQRRYIRTYNVDIATGEEITISKMLQLKGLEANKINAKIKEEIKKVSEAEKAYSNYSETYKRDTELATEGYYDVENIKNFMIGKNGELLLIYNYGNGYEKYTTQFDVIKIEE